MADVYLIDINQNDSLNDVIRKCNHNFKVAYSGQQRQTRNYVQREQADVTARLEGIEEGLEDEAIARSNADSNLSIRIDNIHQLPAGGTVGQALVKSSTTDYDTSWADIEMSGIPTFYYATKPAESDLSETPCIVVQTSDWSVWYCDTTPAYHQLNPPTDISGKVSKSGDTMTGTLRAPFYESKTQLPSIYGGAPSSNSFSRISSAQDTSNNMFWYSEGYHGSDDYTGYSSVAYRRVNGSDVYLGLLMAIGPTGWRHAELNTDNFLINGRAQVNGDFEVRNLIDFHGGDNWSADYTTRLVAPRDDGEIVLQAANGNPRFVAYKGGNANLSAAMFANGEGGKFQWIAPDGSESVIDSWNSSHSRIYNFYQGNYHAVTWERGRDYDLNQIYDRSLPLWGGTLTGRLAINANGVKSWFGSANNGWVNFSNEQGKPNYFEQGIHCAGDFFIYATSYVMLRTANTRDRINWMAANSNNYLHITTWNYGNYGVTWWSSDIRLKDNIANSEVDALEVVNQIQHRSFDMKSDGEHHDIGYVAQELEKLDPQMVTKVYQSREVNGVSYFTGDYQYQVDERKIIPYLSRSIQQLSEENEQLKAKNAELEERLAAIEERLGL